MTRRTQLVSMLGLGGALLLSSAAQAQRPAGAGAPGGPPGSPPPAVAPAAPGAAAESGAVTNETTTTTTTTTDIDSGGVLTDQPVDTLPNTGGAPWLMALAGSATAGSALLLRRKLS